jgi:hypothetical protein
MRIRLHSTTFAGQPLPGTGPELDAPTAVDLVDMMHLDNPFTAAKSKSDYCLSLLRRVEGEGAQPLPDDPVAGAESFFRRLAAARFITIVEQ